MNLEPVIESLAERLIETLTEMCGDLWDRVDAVTRQRDIDAIKLCAKFLVMGVFTDSEHEGFDYFSEASRSFRTIRADVLAEVESYKRDVTTGAKRIITTIIVGLAKGAL